MDEWMDGYVSVSEFIYVYMCTCVCVCMCMYRCAFVFACDLPSMYMCACACVLARTCVRGILRVFAYTWIRNCDYLITSFDVLAVIVSVSLKCNQSVNKVYAAQNTTVI